MTNDELSTPPLQLTDGGDTQPSPSNSIREFKLDVPTVEVDIDVSSNPAVQKIVSAQLSRPSKDQLIKREAMSLTEIVEANATEDDIVFEDERGNAYLFDEIVRKVKGFRLKSEDKAVVKDFRPATEELLAAIYPSFKAAFVKGMYNISAKFVDDEDEGVLLSGNEVLPVDLFIGDEENPVAVVRFEVPEPAETERRNYSNDSVKLRQPKGSRKSRNRIISNLGAAVKFFDSLMSRDEADITADVRVTVGGKTFNESKGIGKQLFLDAIDPIYKRAVVSALMSKYNAKVSD